MLWLCDHSHELFLSQAAVHTFEFRAETLSSLCAIAESIMVMTATEHVSEWKGMANMTRIVQVDLIHI